MPIQLSNIRELGRYRNKEGKEFNIKKGTRKSRGIDMIFYLYRGVRQFVPDNVFYDEFEKVPNSHH